MQTTIRKGAARLIALFAAFALAACSTVAQESGAARPALWQVADEDTTIYLFGTIHALPEGTEWRTPALDRAIAASDELVTEIRLADPAAAAASFVRLGLAVDLPPVLERVPEPRREALREALAGTGIPLPVFDRMKTWAVAITIAQQLFQSAGIDPELGVERVLTADFEARQKTLGQLETVEQQFGFFDSLPEAAQRTFLEGVLETPEEVRRQFDAMLAAWRAGDVAAIGRTFNEEATMSADLREILLVRRNAAWAAWIAERLERPGTVMVAVGAGHLAGEDSVQDFLERRRLRARRVQ